MNTEKNQPVTAPELQSLFQSVFKSSGNTQATVAALAMVDTRTVQRYMNGEGLQGPANFINALEACGYIVTVRRRK